MNLSVFLKITNESIPDQGVFQEGYVYIKLSEMDYPTQADYDMFMNVSNVFEIQPFTNVNDYNKSSIVGLFNPSTEVGLSMTLKLYESSYFDEG
jgi:hypothetical protein